MNQTDDLKNDIKEITLAAYKSYRDEVIQRLGSQNSVLGWLIGLTGTFVGFVVAIVFSGFFGSDSKMLVFAILSAGYVVIIELLISYWIYQTYHICHITRHNDKLDGNLRHYLEKNFGTKICDNLILLKRVQPDRDNSSNKRQSMGKKFKGLLKKFKRFIFSVLKQPLFIISKLPLFIISKLQPLTLYVMGAVGLIVHYFALRQLPESIYCKFWGLKILIIGILILLYMHFMIWFYFDETLGEKVDKNE